VNNSLAEVPDLALMPRMERLFVDGNLLSRLPHFHPSAPLFYISATFNALSSVDKLPPTMQRAWFSDNPFLQSLNFTGCSALVYLLAQRCPSLTALWGLDSLVSVKTVWIDYAKLEDISGLAVATEIELLSVRNNYIKALPDMSQWRALKKLNAIQNEIESVLVWPASPYLSEVSLYYNRITVFGNLSALTGLEVFWVAYNNVQALPDFSTNRKLRQIWASNNTLGSLPPLQHLPNLEVLICHNNAITELPILPVSLQHLLLGNNRLTTVDVEHLSRLQNLVLYDNLLSAVPTPSICNELVAINLSHNVIANVAVNLQGCTSLQEFDMSFNLQSEASWKLPQGTLGSVNLTGNCFSHIDPEEWHPWSIVHIATRAGTSACQ